MSLPDPAAAAREALRHGPGLLTLAEFAAAGHGFGDSDGGFGVTYPGDLDDYDRVVLGLHIPAGCVEVYGYEGPPDGYELVIPERLYLTELAAALTAAGHSDAARRVRQLNGGRADRPAS